MRPALPKLSHPPEVYAAILQEHRSEPIRLAQTLQTLGWSLSDAAWVAIHWPLDWLAAAIAQEKQSRGIKPHGLSDDALTKLRTELLRQPPGPPKARKIPRIKPNDKKEK